MIHRVGDYEAAKYLQELIIEDARLLVEGQDPADIANLTNANQAELALSVVQRPSFLLARRVLEILALGPSARFPKPRSKQPTAVVNFTHRMNKVLDNLREGQSNADAAFAPFSYCGTRVDFRKETNAIKSLIKKGIQGVRDANVNASAKAFCDHLDEWIEESEKRSYGNDRELLINMFGTFEDLRSSLHREMSKPHII